MEGGRGVGRGGVAGGNGKIPHLMFVEMGRDGPWCKRNGDVGNAIRRHDTICYRKVFILGK